MPFNFQEDRNSTPRHVGSCSCVLLPVQRCRSPYSGQCPSIGGDSWSSSWSAFWWSGGSSSTRNRRRLWPQTTWLCATPTATRMIIIFAVRGWRWFQKNQGETWNEKWKNILVRIFFSFFGNKDAPTLVLSFAVIVDENVEEELLRIHFILKLSWVHSSKLIVSCSMRVCLVGVHFIDLFPPKGFNF